MLKHLRIIGVCLLISIASQLNGQDHEMYFSVSGDTICYAGSFGFDMDSVSGSIGHMIYIRSDGKDGRPKTLSSFAMICDASNQCLQSLNADTLRKYRLQNDGTDAVRGPGSDLHSSVIPISTHSIALSDFGPKYIYQSTVDIEVYCKGQTLYKKTIRVMFKGNTPNDFHKEDFVRINVWQKKNTRKYAIDLHVKEHQVYKKPSDKPETEFASYLFIL